MAAHAHARVAEVYANQNVLVTGGTGFMGKVLLEKLLRSCPQVGTVFVLVRPRKGKSAEERVSDIVSTPLFGPLVEKNPKVIGKLKGIAGDCSEIGLGLSPADKERLIQDVSIIFHCAASVRFDDPLQKAVLLNTRGTREVVELAKKMKGLKVLQYVSTTFCRMTEPVLKEKIYPTDYDWRAVIELCEKEDPLHLYAMLNKILAWQPNTYLFSKALAEQVINDARHDIPVMIFRPALVVNSLEEPIPGWVDNLYGPFTFWLGANTGLLRYFYITLDEGQPFTYVDWGIRGMLISAWARARSFQPSSDGDELFVVNMEHDELLTVQDQMDYLEMISPYSPQHIRYPRAYLCSSYVQYWLGAMYSHVLFGIIVDTLLALSGRERRLLAIYRKAFNIVETLKTILSTPVKSEVQNIWQVEKLLREEDLLEFSCCINTSTPGSLKYDKAKYVIDIVKGLGKYVLKQESLEVEKSKSRLRWLYVADIVQYLVMAALFLWMAKSFFW